MAPAASPNEACIVSEVVVTGDKQYTRRSLYANHLLPIIWSDGKVLTRAQVIEAVQSLQRRMMRLGVYKDVIATIIDDNDTITKSVPVGTKPVRVELHVQEQRLALRVGTELERRDQSVSIIGTLLNPTGRADKLDVSTRHGLLASSPFQVTYSTPIAADPDRQLALSVFKTLSDSLPQKRYTDDVQGASISFGITSAIGRHDWRAETAWRRLYNQAAGAPVALRAEAGQSMKHSVTHTFTRDLRDDSLLPTRGYLLRLMHEWAGWGSDTCRFLKQEGTFQFNLPLFANLSLSTTVRAGIVSPLGPTTRIGIQDRFFLAGPPSFTSPSLVVGPVEKGDPLGGDTFFEASAALTSPVPRFSDKVLRAHAFVKASQLVHMGKPWDDLSATIKSLTNLPFVSVGVGLRHRFANSLRVELNVSLPIESLQTAHVSDKSPRIGLQFEFL